MSHALGSPEFAQFVAQLPAEQQQEFFALVARIQTLGDVARLDDDERQRLMVFAEAFAGSRDEITTPDGKSPSANPVNAEPTTAKAPLSTQFLRTPLVALVRETLNAELCTHGGSLADAISYAFHNKWLPEQWKDEAYCEQLFNKYRMEIESHNVWRADLESVHKINEDKRFAVGLAWFNTIYRLQQLLNDGLDLDQA